ncbi:hypothetical protein [Streptomyces sp. NBC_01451]|uniref:hypothetical protein n=1 Tax=Streptomyces sp. NBC_01451 TaxID=2903872 RepID=UPI002E32A1F3|nr:hypothetical protein [Streptomyces sp. NBC_01451]
MRQGATSEAERVSSASPVATTKWTAKQSSVSHRTATPALTPIDTAKTCAHARVAEMNGQVAENLDRMIDQLEDDTVHHTSVSVSGPRDRPAQDRGRERHVVVDTFGVLLSVGVTAVDTGDRAVARVLLRQVADAQNRLALVWEEHAAATGSPCMGSRPPFRTPARASCPRRLRRPP